MLCQLFCLLWLVVFRLFRGVSVVTVDLFVVVVCILFARFVQFAVLSCWCLLLLMLMLFFLFVVLLCFADPT